LLKGKENALQVGGGNTPAFILNLDRDKTIFDFSPDMDRGARITELGGIF